MSLFFETIKIQNGKINNLSYHNKRLNETIKSNFNTNSNIDLSEVVDHKEKKAQRCKIIYNQKIKDIQFFPIIKREFKSFKFITSNIKYDFKSVDRDGIETLFQKRDKADEIIIIKNDLVTDAAIANIAYFDGEVWITPKSPLLKGTMRAYLLEHKLLLEKDVKIKDIKQSKKFAILNAIVGFYEIKDAKFYD